MAARARRSAHFAAVDTLTKLNHFSCCAFRNGKRRRASLWMRALWRLCGHLGRIAGRSRCARTWRDVFGTAFGAVVGAASIDNPVDTSANIVGHIERTVRSHRQATRTMFGFARRLHRSREPIRKYLALAGCSVPGERLKHDVVAALRIWRPVPGPVEGDEDAVTIARWKLLLVVPHHCIRRPMSGKRHNRTNLVRAYADRFAVAPVLRRQNQLLRERVVVALGPSIVSLWLQKQQLLRRQRRLLIGFVQIGPIRVQLVASVLGHKHSPACVDRKAFRVADSRSEALSR